LALWIGYSNAEMTSLRLAWVMSNGIPNPMAGQGDNPVIELPIGLWFVLFAFLGTIVGLILGWFLSGNTRVRARQQGRRARQAERDLETVKKESDTAKAEIDGLKTEKRDLETKVKASSDSALAAPSDVKQITSD